ncbi:glycosyltransferase family 4 protein [Rhizobium phaseoli]|uniref:glycosyltransferase n=1 Tax=Rhizobium phaseoli TaxID=396 RepID=UPI000F85F0F1|nr:glycosyltransferase [Rhizobium phaseoli]RUM14919.1 glycosyltransferase family 4 protein [Rhizobium phaseoli]
MKIAIVAPIQHPIAKPFRGGIESQLWFLTRGLVSRGHDVSLFAAADSDDSLPLHPIVESSVLSAEHLQKREERWIEKYRRFQRNRIADRAYSRMVDSVRALQFDIVHNNSLSKYPLANANRLGAPVVTTIHTPVFKEVVEGAKIAKSRKGSDFVCVSRFLQQSWQAYIDSKVAYNGVEISNWEFNETPDPKKTAIWYGRLNRQKAPHVAIRAALDAGFSISLYGLVEDLSYFEGVVKPLLDPERAVYHGLADHSELSVAIGRASVAVFLPDWDEPFGLTFVEALACGTPIVAYRSGAAPEIVDENSGVLVDRNANTDFQQVFVRASQLSRRDCRDRARQFSMDSMLSNYERIYSETIRGAGIRQ